MRRLEGKVALVTGGARGIGEGIVRRFVSEGAQVMISDVLDAEGQTLADELGQSYVHLDVASKAEWDAAIDATEARWGRLDCLVNNAGVLVFKRLDDLTEDDIRRIIDINLIGTMFGAQAAIPALAHCLLRVEVRRSRIHQGSGARARPSWHQGEFNSSRRHCHGDLQSNEPPTRSGRSRIQDLSRTACR